MRKKMIKILSLILSLSLIAGVIFSVPMTVSAVDESGSIYPSTLEGDCGDDARFYCFPDASMAIFGNGAIQNYELSANNVSTAPWYRQIENLSVTLFINKIAIEYGITEIGDYAFYFPDTVYQEIHDEEGNTISADNPKIDQVETSTYAYYRMIAQLYNVDIAYSVTRIGDYAFYNQKMEHIIIPGQVTEIGRNAFKGTDLKDITYYGNPNSLIWEGMDDPSDNEFNDTKHPSGITCHIIKGDVADAKRYGYSHSDIDTFNSKFSNKHITFVDDLDFPYADIEDVNRDIGVYFGSTNSKVFGGAAPFIIVGNFNGVKKSTTYGSAGYVSCVKMTVNNQTKYYILTDSSTGRLNEAIVNSSSGKVTGYNETPLSGVTLKITPRYIGSDIVKMVYTLENNSGSQITNVCVGGTGDIKIGADDYAALEPLMDSEKQVGIYMRSRNTQYDMVMTGDIDSTTGDPIPQYATFGFIGKNVKKDQSGGTGADNLYDDANFFYGAVGANKSAAATGTKSMVLVPERIFTEGSAAVTATDESSYYNRDHKKDSGLSYHWDNITLDSGSSKELAVMFSVYGVKSTADADSTAAPDAAIEGASSVAAVEDSKKDADGFYTVYWVNDAPEFDGEGLPTPASTIAKQIIKPNSVPIYTGATPTKAYTEDEAHYYQFDRWELVPEHGTVNVNGAVTSNNTVFKATFDVKDKNRLFVTHSLSLNGDIAVNFYLNKAEVDSLLGDGRSAKITFTRYVMEEKKTESVPLSLKDADRNVGGTDCYKVTCSVPAAEMSYNIHAVVTYGTGDESTWETHWDKDNYSVREYGEYIIAHPDEMPGTEDNQARLVALAYEMLNYGAKAQMIFNRLDVPLANAHTHTSYTACDTSVTASDFDTAVAGEKINKDRGLSGKSVETPENFPLNYEGATVVFLSKTSLRLYYTVKDGDAPKYSFFDRSTGETVTNKDFTKNGDYVYAEFTDIPAAELDVLQEITINGETFYYSVLDYAKLLYDDPLPGDQYTAADEEAFGLSIYLYNRAANTYFDNLTP